VESAFSAHERAWPGRNSKSSLKRSTGTKRMNCRISAACVSVAVSGFMSGISEMEPITAVPPKRSCSGTSGSASAPATASAPPPQAARGKKASSRNQRTDRIIAGARKGYG
jgi:hypothetical protein